MKTRRGDGTTLAEVAAVLDHDPTARPPEDGSGLLDRPPLYVRALLRIAYVSLLRWLRRREAIPYFAMNRNP